MQFRLNRIFNNIFYWRKKSFQYREGTRECKMKSLSDNDDIVTWNFCRIKIFFPLSRAHFAQFKNFYSRFLKFHFGETAKRQNRLVFRPMSNVFIVSEIWWHSAQLCCMILDWCALSWCLQFQLYVSATAIELYIVKFRVSRDSFGLSFKYEFVAILV